MTDKIQCGSRYVILLCFALFALAQTASAQGAPAEIANSISMKLLRVHAGTFVYGPPHDSPRPNLWANWYGSAQPITIALTNDYYLGRFEVTQAQFKKTMGRNPSRFKGARLPVDSVTWNEAAEFCARLSALPAEKTAGRVYSLPTAAEWEYACRAGSKSAFPWGDEDETRIGESAWCHDWYGPAATQTHPVGTKKPNAWGFYDMVGNVWEWCADAAFSGDGNAYCYARTSAIVTNPVSPADPKLARYSFAIRGGAWNSDFRSANCFMTVAQRPLCRANDTGFRVKCLVNLSAQASGR